MYWRLAFSEGKWYVLVLVVLTALAGWVYPLLTVVPLAGLLFVLYFFRDPRREPRVNPQAILAPADGRVTRICQTDCEFAGEGSWEISIFMSPFNVHVNRSPLAGEVQKVEHIPGKFIRAMDPAAPLVNERNIILIDGIEPVKVVQVAGIVARRVVSWVTEGTWVEQGDKVGMIKFSSCTQIVFPGHWKPVVEKGDTVLAGLTILGEKP